MAISPKPLIHERRVRALKVVMSMPPASPSMPSAMLTALAVNMTTNMTIGTIIQPRLWPSRREVYVVPGGTELIIDHQAVTEPAMNWRMSFSWTKTPRLVREPNQTDMRLKAVHGKVTHTRGAFSSHCVRDQGEDVLEFAGAALGAVYAHEVVYGSEEAENSMTPIGTYVKLRDQLNR